jgi:hypothetical protein
MNLYGFIENSATNNVDINGLIKWSTDLPFTGSIMAFTSYTATFTIQYDDEACSISVAGPVFTGVSIAPPNSPEVLHDVTYSTSTEADCCTVGKKPGKAKTITEDHRFRFYLKVGYKDYSYSSLVTTITKQYSITCGCK